MKGVAVLVFLGLCGLVCSRPDEKYTTKYDNVDLDAIIKNDRLLRSYIDCVLGKKNCTKDGEELKSSLPQLVKAVHLPDALQTNCQKCSEAQRNGSRKIIRHLLKNKRDWWNELEAKFDPQGTYVKRYADELKKEGIVL